MLINTIRKEGAVLRLPSILLVAAQSRRECIVTQPLGKAKSPDEPTQAVAPTGNPQSTCTEVYIKKTQVARRDTNDAL
jgi:hypothetical protein